jgi:hypothetical protein
MIGGPSLDGSGIRVSPYNERVPIPLQVTQELDAEGHVGKQVAYTARQGIVREVEAEMILSIDAAKVVIDWLQKKVAEAEKLAEEIAKSKIRPTPDAQGAS